MQLHKKPGIIKKNNQDFNGRYGNELKTSVLLKGFGSSMVRIVPMVSEVFQKSS